MSLIKFNSFAKFLVAGLSLCALATSAQAAIFDRVVARVNDEIVTESALNEKLRVELFRIQQAGLSDEADPEEIRRNILKRIIEEKLILERGAKLGLDVDEASLEKALADIRTSNNLAEGQLEMMLESEGRSLDDYKKTIRNQIMVSKVIQFEIQSKMKLSDRQKLSYYRKHQKEFWEAGKVHAYHILFILDDNLTEEEAQLKKSKARLVLEKIGKGEDFETLAKIYSEDITASSGGDLGVMERGKMVPEFEKAAFGLKQGEISGIVTTPYGLHIIKVTEKISGRTLPYDEAKEKIVGILRQKKQAAVFKQYMAELRENAFIEIRLKATPKVLEKSRATAAGERKIREKAQRKHDVANILPPLRIKKRVATSPDAFKKEKPFQSLEEKLKHYKKLRDSRQISESDYQKMKRRLLSNL